MPPKKDKEEIEASQSSGLEAREGRKLNEISKKLSLILTAIETLTDTINNNNNKSSNRTEADLINPALNEMTKVLSNFADKVTSNQETQCRQNTQKSLLAEEEALRIKSNISNTWEFKLKKRRDEFWGQTKNEGHKETYTK